MDAAEFTDQAPGKLIQIAHPKKVLAFVPNELPPKWEFDATLWPLLVDAKEALGTLNGIGQTLPNPELLLRPLQSREAITSSRIEGTFVTPEQLLLYELDPREPKSASDQQADWMEVFNYSQALKVGSRLLGELPICNRITKEMHRVLLTGVRGRGKRPGEFRSLQVQIGSRGRFVPPPPQQVDRLMGNFERYVNSESPQLDPVVRAYILHYQFETIHPFSDGNGRVGRALISLMIYHWLDHSAPWLYMSPYFEQYRDEYVENLFNVSTKGDWSEWLGFCLRGTVAQAKDSIERCHKFKQLRLQYLSRITSRSPRTLEIIEGLFAAPVVTIPIIAERFNITYHTARSDISRLVEVGILHESESGHPRSFMAPELIKIAYSEQGDIETNETQNAPPQEPAESRADSQTDVGDQRT